MGIGNDGLNNVGAFNVGSNNSGLPLPGLGLLGLANHGTFNEGFFNTGNHNLGAFLNGDNLVGIGPCTSTDRCGWAQPCWATSTIDDARRITPIAVAA
ncbi:pentapeptide repeats family protein [Mycobacterium ulcerans str. Harvey]|uniref:Pentapeptide repeats family protein n=1 Tax=Mycobacterium ulcerans str. Harvey TaxID=1299332 RepID=A0ABN0QN80_MYCUL|nr:pentapeptide repeats family protein [Mycobacterium ulcerans str. Harvey]